jgi:pimeloyl-ACP methyl ester carboxylesterase
VSSATRPRLEPLGGDWLRPLLDADGRTVGAVSVPIGAREARPVVVAVHGAASRPDWMCSAVRASVGPSPFVLCPHPTANITTEASWRSAAALRVAIDRAAVALVGELGPYVEREDALYIGHSQGGMIAPAALAAKGPTRFRYALFFEGLPHDRSAAKEQLLGTGIERLVLLSGQSGWKSGHRAFAASFEGTPVVATHRHIDAGHFFNGEVQATIAAEVERIVADSDRWRVGRPTTD